MILALFLTAASAASMTLAPQDTTGAQLPTVRVSIARDAGRSILDLPFALTRIMPDSVRPGMRNATIDERLLLLPGVIVANRSNPTQDPRISVRGFGSRAAFGVRGVRVLYDGVPLTLPDGQTALDYLDLESIGSIELIRGSASSLYGNAAGGVLDIRSRPIPETGLEVGAGMWMAEEGQSRFNIFGGGNSGNISYALAATRLESDGVRDHARQKLTNGSLRLGTRVGAFDIGLNVLAHDMPLAENPGALTLAEMRDNNRAAEALAVRRNARKEVNQVQLGLTLSTGAVESGQLEVVLHGGDRDLYNPLQFAIIDVQRRTMGLSARYSRQFNGGAMPVRLTAGVDYQDQDDERTEFTNCNEVPPLSAPTATCPSLSTERGTLRRDQAELVSSIGPFVRGEVALSPAWILSAGLRADRISFELKDDFINENNADDSGERTLEAISPAVGLVFKAGPLASLYASFSSAFETPTATEFGNKPDGSVGFNPELDPQRSTTLELGARGWLQLGLASGITYDVALYSTAVKDELIPFEIPGGAGRRFFRNAGSTSRRGLEAALGTTVGPVDLALSYTLSDFSFDDYVVAGTEYDGKVIPGIPGNQLHGSATIRHREWYLVLEGEARGKVYVDDANSSRAAGYETMNVRVGGAGVFGLDWLAPRVGVTNLFDRNYAASISVNASAGRYFEPAPGRIFFAGLAITY